LCGLLSGCGRSADLLDTDAKRNVPPRTFKFPKRVGDGRSCQHEWFNTHGWLHYNQDKDAVFCFTCIQARRHGKSSSGRGYEDAYVTSGFKQWQKAKARFCQHEQSQFHRESAEFLVQALQRESVASLLNIQLKKDQRDSRTAYKIVISSIRYLARSGQALRGSDMDKGNLVELLEERALECPELQDWLKKRDNWLSGDIQNEILEILAHSALRKIVSDINEAEFFSIMADGTTDGSGDEQLAVCFRYVDKKSLESLEVLVGLYNVTSKTAASTHQVLKDVMLRLGIKNEKMRGHCFDGEAAMSGRLNGVQKLLTDDQPKSMFVHCSNHSLDLVIQELARQCPMISDTLMLVKEVSKIILESAKRKAIYENIVIQPCAGDNDGPEQRSTPQRLLSLCATRWCIRAKAMRRFLENYERVRDTVREILKDRSCNISDERRALLRGFEIKMYQFPTLLSLKLALSICEPAEQLAKSLQSKRYTATGAKQSAQALWDLYNSMGEDDFNRIWNETELLNQTHNLNLSMPEPPRRRVPPRRLGEVGGHAPAAVLTEKDRLRQKYISVLDWTKTELDRRFNQPGMQQLIKLESIILANPPPNAEDLETTLGLHAEDFDIPQLAAQLFIAKTVVPSHEKTVREYADFFKDLAAITRTMLNELERLIILILTVPATSASCERSFSALRRVKNWLRRTMSQKRVTHVMLLHVHKALTLSIDINSILEEFVKRTPERMHVFGNMF